MREAPDRRSRRLELIEGQGPGPQENGSDVVGRQQGFEPALVGPETAVHVKRSLAQRDLDPGDVIERDAVAGDKHRQRGEDLLKRSRRRPEPQ